ncbi:MAG: DUF4783 domain-containing protein [Bacteroidia bacterium]|nr:DUF4783 domain-containing protein [Bacteroidia bacterium]
MIKKIKIIPVVCMLCFTAMASVDIYSVITDAILDSDARAISQYFNKNVEMTIIDEENVYSKTQAEQVLRDFFTKNKPASFRIIHKGVSKEGAKYAIGNLITVSGVEFRTYFFVKNVSSGEFIQELRFEKE